MQIKVIDMPMGTGKTTGIIEYMNSNPQNKYLFITPFLSEVQRIKENCPELEFKEPDGKYSKLSDLKHLIANCENIVSTHALFSIIDKQIIKLLKAGGYTLILDEVLEVVEPLDLAQRDFQLLLNDNVVTIEDDNKVVLSDNSYVGVGCKFTKEINMIKNQNVYFIDDTLLLCLFNPDVFSAFEDCIILTYLFKGSLMQSYCDLFQLDYLYYYINNDKIIKGKYNDVEFKKQLKKLIHIYDGRLNNIGENITSLSANWYKDKKKKDEHIILKRNIYNYFRNIVKSNCNSAMWSTLTGHKNNYKEFYAPTRYKKNTFIPCNMRATNDYSHKKDLIYAVNVYINPYVCRYFTTRNINVYDDLYAISQLLQWIYRSQVRNNKPINIYIPSKRMRELLLKYFDNVE